MSQYCGRLKQEFQLRHFGFGDVHFARFVHSQWHLPGVVVLVYRFLTMAVIVSWMLYDATLTQSLNLNGVDVPAFAFLTEWTFFVLALYLTIHFIVCLMYACRRGGSMFTRPTAETHRALFKELEVFPSLWSPQDYQSIPGAVSPHNQEHGYQEADVMVTQADSLSWIFKVVWILYNVASFGGLMVTIVFWTMLYPYLNLSGMGLVNNFMLHATNSIVIILEHLVSAVPFRLLHVVYPVVYGVIYVVFSGIYYAMDHRHVLYPNILDWGQPARTAVVIVVIALVVVPLLQLFFFGIYKLRMFIYDKYHPEQL